MLLMVGSDLPCLVLGSMHYATCTGIPASCGSTHPGVVLGVCVCLYRTGMGVMHDCAGAARASNGIQRW